ncbi:ABC transporter substrate-binding protein [Mesorhizobium sp. B3-1-3]|uniref:ABC transporter substrate-binding protein n=1 Tax=unclassified Mesorhizobium TaxID=325217 RepID=UPI00112BFE5D|nr:MULTISPECIES: ABC transporter substrate-binding protein [unclassified Mesorhizobium]TPI57369.1 ABC transporter substrate-binding protein [Mesorhizobium sp. B3-1-8]TPI63522.1 ABC transporter substrate-binding protein [Mesorhizobium sp. B3-1-3]
MIKASDTPRAGRAIRTAFLSTTVAVMLASSLGAVSAQEKPLIIARNLAVNSLDPARTSCDTCNIFLYAVYETLVRLGDDNKTINPALAQKWEVNGDNTEFTFHLNPKAVFADGSPVEAKDVKWSWDRLANLQGGMAWLFETVKSIEAPDAHTVIVKLTQPDSEFLGKVIAPYAGIVNSNLAIEHGAKAGKDDAASDSAEPWFLANSAGSGPYALESYSPNDELRFKRNAAYWDKPAAIDEIVIKQTKDSVAQAQVLQSGDVDIAMQIAPDTAKTINAPGVTVETVPSYNFIYMAISPGAKSNKVPMDTKVRQAIAYALDYQGIIDFTIGGAGKMVPVAIPNGFPGTDGLPMPVHDVEKAKALLKEAGLADGFDMESVFPNENYYGVDMSTLMQLVQQDLAKVNIRLQLKPVTFPVWLDTVKGDGTSLTASFYAPDYYGTDQYVKTFGMIPGTRWLKRSGAERVQGVLNMKEKELLDKAVASPTDVRDKLYNEIALEMIKDRVIVPLVGPDTVLAYSSKVQGMKYSVTSVLPLQDLSIKK